MIIRISNTLIQAAPSKKWIQTGVGERLKRPLPEIMPPPMDARASYYVDSWTAKQLNRLANESGRRAGEIFISCLIDVLGEPASDGVDRAPVRNKPHRTGGVRAAAVPLAPRKISKSQSVWLAGLEKRRAIIRADIAVGRWGVFIITGGNPAVKPNEPLDAQGVRDFDDEIQQGMVVQELIPWEYSEEEALAWLADRHREKKALSWYYISGDSESLNDLQESRRRGELRADKRFPDMAATLAQVEHEEALEREAFGRKRYYLDWAVRDRDRLLEIGRRDGIAAADAVPKNLAVLAGRAENPALLGRVRVLRLCGGHGQASMNRINHFPRHLTA